MIAYIEGRLAELSDNSVVVVTGGGVGYEVYLPVHTMQRLPEKGAAVMYYTSFIVREDALELFGFETWDERRMFEMLIGLNKVGARTASAILSVFRPDDLRRIVCENDPTPLTRVSGIGKKSAQQIFLELTYKLKADDYPAFSSNPADAVPDSIFKDVLAGLESLGYKDTEVAPILRKILNDEPDLDVPSALRAVLKQTARAGREKI